MATPPGAFDAAGHFGDDSSPMYRARASQDPVGQSAWAGPGAGWGRAASCGLCAGAAGGALAAAVDLVRAQTELVRHLPEGSVRLAAFLGSLYGGALGGAGLVLGLALLGLVRRTVLGPLVRGEGEGVLVPAAAAVVAMLAGAASLGVALYGPTLSALLRFHHRTLIGLLVGVIAAALVPVAAALSLLLLTMLARVRLFALSKQIRLRLPGPPALAWAGWSAALPLCVGAVWILLLHLQQHPRMNPQLRALNTALLAPPLALGAVLVGHLLSRALVWGLGSRAGPWARTLWGTLGAVLLVVVGPALVLAIAYWPTLRILDLRPVFSLAVAGLAAVALAPRLWHWPRRGRAGLLVLLPALWIAALGLGRADRVRKAALSQAPLATPLVVGLHGILDLDGDGFPTRWVVGGSDCDDLDPGVHPAAFDWPDDGIDQNCNGHQATVPPLAPAPWPPLPPGLPPRPNLVLITIDALRADHVGAYGYPRPTTPALDALAREGTLFTRAWAHAPSTRYSVPAILTGRYPSTLSWGSPAHHWPPEVLPDNRLLAEVLRERGYRTLALLSYHYFEPGWGLAQGFDDYDVHLMTLHSIGGDPAATSGSSARELADLAISKLASLPLEAEPFFIWVHFYDPHYRYQHHPEVPTFGDGEREQDQYDNEIRYTDEHIGRMLDALRRRPSWERTVVVVTADHGEGFGEHGIPPDRRHGYHLYANQTRVPLVLRVPGLPSRRVEAPVGHVDIMPTLLQLAGCTAAQEPQLAGRPLLALATGAAERDRVVFQEVMYEGPTVRKALVTERWHYIRNVVPDGTAELYDLENDPSEDRDLQGAPALAGVEGELSRRLAAWMDQSALPADFARRVASNISQGPLPAGTPIGATVGGWLEVVGAEVRTPQVARGGAAEVALVLRVLRRIPPGWRMFTHLRADDGRFLNADHDPVEGLVPLQQLRPGTYVRDVIRIPIPRAWPMGAAGLEVGLFRRGERARVHGQPGVVDTSRDVVRAAKVEIF
ncbi:MAG: sulfatase-like hydrolase/transferase [Myxococcales bacterium]|nr:sulfatase-like hydrolase/transferase [Myxococcota bacterium]MDW8280161.1 sulfatase-like hydrolase/transferase [Myxococcales bacterium]